MKIWQFFLVITISALTGIFGCRKKTSDEQNGPGTQPYSLTYPAAVFYLQSNDYIVSPSISKQGNYVAFPDDLNINAATGQITVSLKGRENKESQTGLKYKIVFTSGSVKDSTFITIAGINYQDRIFTLAQNDTLVKPFYNASGTLPVPAGSVFTSSNNKLSIDPATGVINLKKTIENGFFNDDPQNNQWRVVTIKYVTNDASTSDKNNLDVVVYYYTDTNNIPSNVSSAMRAHQGLLLGLDPVNIPVTTAPVDQSISNIVSVSKPRPPCIIIIGH
jgi:hypothetical protein